MPFRYYYTPRNHDIATDTVMETDADISNYLQLIKILFGFLPFGYHSFWFELVLCRLRGG